MASRKRSGAIATDQELRNLAVGRYYIQTMLDWKVTELTILDADLSQQQVQAAFLATVDRVRKQHPRKRKAMRVDAMVRITTNPLPGRPDVIPVYLWCIDYHSSDQYMEPVEGAMPRLHRL